MATRSFVLGQLLGIFKEDSLSRRVIYGLSRRASFSYFHLNRRLPTGELAGKCGLIRDKKITESALTSYRSPTVQVSAQWAYQTREHITLVRVAFL